jgi:hypothetical protein
VIDPGNRCHAADSRTRSSGRRGSYGRRVSLTGDGRGRVTGSP